MFKCSNSCVVIATRNDKTGSVDMYKLQLKDSNEKNIELVSENIASIDFYRYFNQFCITNVDNVNTRPS